MSTQNVQVTHRPLAPRKPTRREPEWIARCSCGWDTWADSREDAARRCGKHLDAQAARVAAMAARVLPVLRVGDRVTVWTWNPRHDYESKWSGRVTEVTGTHLGLSMGDAAFGNLRFTQGASLHLPDVTRIEQRGARR